MIEGNLEFGGNTEKEHFTQPWLETWGVSEDKLVPMLVTQSCLTLCDPMDCSLLGSSAHGVLPGKNTGVGCHFLF